MPYSRGSWSSLGRICPPFCVRKSRQAIYCFLRLASVLLALLPAAAQDACPDTPRLQARTYARVSSAAPITAYASAGPNSAPAGRIPDNSILWVADGPECVSGDLWWRVEYRALVGWTAETALQIVADEDAPILSISGLTEIIIYESRTAHDSAIFVAAPAGGVAVSYTPPGYSNSAPLVSPDFAQIAFTSVDETTPQAFLGLMGFDGSFRRVIDLVPAVYSWSADSARLLVITLSGTLFVVDAASGTVSAFNGDLDSPSAIAWSPDGAHIAYTHDIRLGIIDLATGAARTLYSAETPLDSPLWSPDSAHIAFSTTVAGVRQFFVFHVEIGSLSQPTGHANTSAFAWSPDGTRIAFAGVRDGDSEIYLVNADGSALTQVTHNTACDTWPSWSPDSSHLVFVSDRDRAASDTCAGDIYIARAAEGDARRLTYNGRDNRSPQWVIIAPALPPN
ncbi:MAG: PD40 domain-containing protein [Chloroflexi bacterium]|nr:PD40 domain-containing protein [Chloroflexota bacterium]